MARASNEGRLRSFLKQHGQPVQDFVPDFDITYDPHDKRKFDLEAVSSTLTSRHALKLCRAVSKKLSLRWSNRLSSAVGTGENYEHFLNWLADIVQFKEKDWHRLGAAWQ
jgi:hypothetical protein